MIDLLLTLTLPAIAILFLVCLGVGIYEIATMAIDDVRELRRDKP